MKLWDAAENNQKIVLEISSGARENLFILHRSGTVFKCSRNRKVYVTGAILPGHLEIGEPKLHYKTCETIYGPLYEDVYYVQLDTDTRLTIRLEVKE